MSAQEYYSSAPAQSRYNYNQQQPNSQSSFDPRSGPPARTPNSTKPSTTYSQNPYPSQPAYDARPPQYHGYGDNSPISRPAPSPFSSDPSFDQPTGNEQYADNIPLKSNTNVAESTSDDGRNQNTKYNPVSMESQRPTSMRPESSKGKGWFKGKIPYVVYFFTLVQITVFIVEIIRNGMLSASSSNIAQVLTTT